MSDAIAKPKSWALKAAVWVAVLGLAAGLYVVLSALSKPRLTDLQPYAKGAMAELILPEAPPMQPNRAFLDPAGKETTLAAFHGKVTLVNFWATYCAPCVEELPTLAALETAMGGETFQVIAINIDNRGGRADAPWQLHELTKGKLAFYSDPTVGIVYAAKARGMPTTILYDKRGNELARYYGATDWASAEAKALIRAAMDRS
jgi:thiol-disulfide isomerase/thioredoxin